MDSYQLTKFKHVVRMNMFQARGVIQKNWFKLIVVLLVAFIIARKDLSVSFNLFSSKTTSAINEPIHQISNTQTVHPEQTSFTTVLDTDQNPQVLGEVSTPPKKKKKKVDANLANTFSNLTFILSPTYAKRKNIPPSIVQEKKDKCNAYLKKYGPIAIQEMRDYGIPASITLAQGLLESNVGDSKLARLNNNHFGIKCFAKSCKKGHCSNYTDDSHKDFFRSYSSAKESYRAHSLFLQKNRYKHLLKLNVTDYKSWAHGLRKAGYATDKKYGPKLIKIIETLKLYNYDK